MRWVHIVNISQKKYIFSWRLNMLRLCALGHEDCQVANSRSTGPQHGPKRIAVCPCTATPAVSATERFLLQPLIYGTDNSLPSHVTAVLSLSIFCYRLKSSQVKSSQVAFNYDSDKRTILQYYNENIDHISSHFIIQLPDSSLIWTVPTQWRYNRYYI